MKKIEAKIIADSKDSRGNRIITYLLTYPRFIHCFDENTKILSQIGEEHPEFRHFNAIDALKCKVAQYDKGNISFVYPSNFIKNSGIQRMITFEKNKFSLCVTDEHRVHTLKRTTNNEFNENTILAKELLGQYGTRKILQAGLMEQKQVYSDSELELIAWYVADGHNEGNTSVFHFRKERKKISVISILENLGIEYSLFEYKNDLYGKEYAIRFDNPNWVDDCYINNIKKLPDSACFMSQNAYLKFKDALLNSDGNVKNNEYNTSSKILAHQIQVIALLHGEAMNIREYFGIYKQKFQKTNYISLRHDKDIFQEKYINTNTYCVTVPSSFLVVQRNGISYISGNCELMTHRMFSRNSASCLSGNTVITIEKPSELKKGRRNKHTNMTIKEIVDKWYNGDSRGRDMKNRIKSMNLRCLNEASGEFITTNITNCFRQGIQTVYEVTLENNYVLRCTENHRIFSDKGWTTLAEMGMQKSANGVMVLPKTTPKIATNGIVYSEEFFLKEKECGKNLTQICNEQGYNFKSASQFCEKRGIRFRKFVLHNETFEYKDKNWLKERLDDGFFSPEIAKMCNSTSDRVKKQIIKFGLKGNKYNWGHTPVWNKGLRYKQKEESLVNIRKAAQKRRKPDSYKTYKNFNIAITRFLSEIRREIFEKYNYKCLISGYNQVLELHHVVPVWYNPELAFDKTNIVPITKKIHRFIHSNNLDLEFMKWVHSGNKLSEFINKYKDIKLLADDIKKPKPTRNTLCVKYLKIISVKDVGKEETYDIEVNAPFHNFVANGFVVHNSRAIPFEKMVQMVKEDPFIPIAWQKDHSGMQGTEYFTDKSEIDILKDNWMTAKDRAVTMAKELHLNGLTKQLCNRLLEPFMWHTVLVTATSYDNFFELRCPQYIFGKATNKPKIWKSKKDAIKDFPDWEIHNDLFWRTMNESQAEIHIQALAESMYDAYNESTPKELKAGEWHIPFGDNIDITTKSKIVSQENNRLIEKYDNPMSFSLPTIDLRALIEPLKVKIATARCARLSYMNFEGKIDYEKDIELHDKLLISKHASPFEHCARVMSDKEYYSFVKGVIPTQIDEYGITNLEMMPLSSGHPIVGFTGLNPTNGDKYGWSDNLRGFISYRHLIENM